MADTPSTPSGSGDKSSFGFLTRKVGPLPIIAWAGLAFGVYYWYTHWGPGAPTTATATTATAGPVFLVPRGKRGARGPRGPAGPPDKDDKKHDRDRKATPRPARGAQPAMPLPVPASAPMTAGAGPPAASMDGAVYDAGPPAAAMEGAYVPAA